MKIDKFFAGFNISAMGLTAQRKRMNAIASNMANAETTKTEDGGPYRRKIVTVKAGAQQSFSSDMSSMNVELATTNEQHMSGFSESPAAEATTTGGSVQSTEVTDNSPFKIIYDPGHPDADKSGYVKMPNVNIVTEMVDMISATRSYEANVTAIDGAKTMAKDALEI